MKLPIYLFVCLLLFAACSSDPVVTRVDSSTTTDLSGEWNDTDSRLVANSMIDDLLSQSWYQRATSVSGQQPTIVVGKIRNLSHEHINSTVFTNDIERALVNSNRVELVASSGNRELLREERAAQDIHATEETRKEAGKEIGADLILQGTINTILDANSKNQVRFYQVDLELVEIETTKKVWIGQKKIKKVVGKKKTRL